MNYLLVGFLGIPLIATVALDSQANVPLGWLLGRGTTILLVGMWVSRKVTTFESQQIRNIDRLDAIERRLDHMDRLERKR